MMTEPEFQAAKEEANRMLDRGCSMSAVASSTGLRLGDLFDLYRQLGRRYLKKGPNDGTNQQETP